MTGTACFARASPSQSWLLTTPIDQGLPVASCIVQFRRIIVYRTHPLRILTTGGDDWGWLIDRHKDNSDFEPSSCRVAAQSVVTGHVVVVPLCRSVRHSSYATGGTYLTALCAYPSRGESECAGDGAVACHKSSHNAGADGALGIGACSPCVVVSPGGNTTALPRQAALAGGEAHRDEELATTSGRIEDQPDRTTTANGTDERNRDRASSHQGRNGQNDTGMAARPELIERWSMVRVQLGPPVVPEERGAGQGAPGRPWWVRVQLRFTVPRAGGRAGDGTGAGVLGRDRRVWADVAYWRSSGPGRQARRPPTTATPW